VCVLVNRGETIERTEQTFSTKWGDLVLAAQWARSVVTDLADPGAVDDMDDKGLAFTIESTGTYHMPVMQAFASVGRSVPSVVNPLLANPSRRKTDVLDSRLLAYHALSGMWPASYIPPPAIQSLRIMVNMREDAMRRATRASNRINNFILRYGHTLGAEHRVTDSAGRALVEDLLERREPVDGGVCPAGIPAEVVPVFEKLYEEYDEARAAVNTYEAMALAWADQCEFALGGGVVVPGTEVRRLLGTIPGFSTISSLYWMAEVVTPCRFANAKALGAYAGCDPSLKVSAGKVTQHSRRGGNQKLHVALTRAAQALIVRPHEEMGSWGHRMWKSHKTGGFKKACGAVARRMAEASFHVTRTGTDFDYRLYSYYGRPEYATRALTPVDLGRYSKVLSAFTTVADLAEALHDGRLSSTKGVGDKCLEHVQKLTRAERLSSRQQPESATSSQPAC
jgi:transposase